jgi:hypothetical protein
MAGAAVEFNDLLGKEGIDPKTVLVLRHRPRERELRKVLPWLAAERPDTYNAYQQQQSPSVETAMVRGLVHRARSGQSTFHRTVPSGPMASADA